MAQLTKNEVKGILRKEYVELHKAIQSKPAAITRQLYARDFITISTRDTATSNQTTATDEAKADTLMKEIEAVILTHEHPGKSFDELLEILEEAGGVANNVATSIRKVPAHVHMYSMVITVTEHYWNQSWAYKILFPGLAL